MSSVYEIIRRNFSNATTRGAIEALRGMHPSVRQEVLHNTDFPTNIKVKLLITLPIRLEERRLVISHPFMNLSDNQAVLKEAVFRNHAPEGIIKDTPETFTPSNVNIGNLSVELDKEAYKRAAGEKADSPELRYISIFNDSGRILSRYNVALKGLKEVSWPEEYHETLKTLVESTSRPFDLQVRGHIAKVLSSGREYRSLFFSILDSISPKEIAPVLDGLLEFGTFSADKLATSLNNLNNGRLASAIEEGTLSAAAAAAAEAIKVLSGTGKTQ